MTAPTSRTTVLLAACLALAAAPAPLAGQLAYGFDTGLASRYTWRGLTRRNGAVWQTDAFVALRLGPAFVTAGLWTSMEVVRADVRLPDAIGLGRFVGELDGWAELSYACACDNVDLAVGYTRYYFPDRDAAAALGSTVHETGEVYARLAARVKGLAPRARVWYDPEDTRGAYVETELAYEAVVFPAALTLVRLGALGGFSAGQAIRASDPAAPAYFARDGLTHLDFFTGLQVSFAVMGLPLYALPTAHLTVNVDPHTKIVDRTGRLADTRFWVALTVSAHGSR